MSAAEALLTHIADYAGLFPPASLDMQTAVMNYQNYLGGDDAWMLGNFLVPAARLEEFRQAFESICCSEQEHPWTISIVCAGDLTNDSHFIDSFQEGAVFLAGFETRVADAKAAEQALSALPTNRPLYVEFVPESAAAVLPILAAKNARAKLRTGGVTPAAIPNVDAVAQFLLACACERVPFKATAGLHLPVRGEHRLTEDPDSQTATMHGFVNLFLAAALAFFGSEEPAVLRTLSEQDPGAFQLDDDLIRWHGHAFTSDQIEQVRRNFAISFGSCSFDEPVAALRELGWL